MNLSRFASFQHSHSPYVWGMNEWMNEMNMSKSEFSFSICQKKNMCVHCTKVKYGSYTYFSTKTCVNLISSEITTEKKDICVSSMLARGKKVYEWERKFLDQLTWSRQSSKQASKLVMWRGFIETILAKIYSWIVCSWFLLP